MDASCESGSAAKSDVTGPAECLFMSKRPMSITEFARLGGLARAAKMSKAQRIASATRASHARKSMLRLAKAQKSA